MSGVIKAAAAHAVRPLHPASDAPAAADPRPSPPAEDPRIARLAAEAAELRRELESARADAAKAVVKAREEGQREAMLAALRDDEKRIEALSAGVASARERWEKELDGIEALAALVARTSLAKLFARPELYADFVAAMAARQLETLRRDSILRIRVSAADFPDEAALAGFSGATGAGSVAVEASPDLEPGECRIDLQLGHVDIGPRHQWPALASLLERAASPGQPA